MRAVDQATVSMFTSTSAAAGCIPSVPPSIGSDRNSARVTTTGRSARSMTSPVALTRKYGAVGISKSAARISTPTQSMIVGSSGEP